MVYWLVKGALSPFLRLFWRIEVRGRGRVPPSGPVILAANHQSFIDSMFLPLVVRRRVTFLAKAEYFDSQRTAWFFRSMGQIPIRRGGGSASERALESAREVLDHGGVLGVYPEGTRSADGLIYKGRTGVARMALRCNATVVPVAISGTREIQPIDCMRPRLFLPVSLTFGEPLSWPSLHGCHDDAEVIRAVTDEIMNAIASLAGQGVQPDYGRRERRPSHSAAQPGPEPAPRSATSV